MLKSLKKNILAAPHASTTNVERGEVGYAAVLLAITDNEESPEVILTKRAVHLNSHSGEVSLPGGKWETSDADLLQTALRESWEEIDLQPSSVEVIGSLSAAYTWQAIKVAPFVGVVSESIILKPNPNEIDSIFKVPLRFFLEDKRIRTDVFPHPSGQVWSPAYEFDGYEIWGFTARLMINFLNDFCAANIQSENSAPIKDWAHIAAQLKKDLGKDFPDDKT
jgi:8-oxo-dGTP pyrophosphatase MutT (NUDIX family)